MTNDKNLAPNVTGEFMARNILRRYILFWFGMVKG
jgi:hypothetical protein